MADKTDLQLADYHKYRLLNGDIAISVTKLTGLLDDGKAGAFAGAAVKLTKAGLDYRKEWAEKASRGTRVHDHALAWSNGETVDQQEDEAGYLDALERFIVERQPTWLEREEIVVSSRGYGGRFDMIVQMPDHDVWLIDIKTGRDYALEHTLQLNGYAFADGIATFDENGNLSGTRPLPPIHRAGDLYLGDNGTYRLIEYPLGERPFGLFCHLLETYKALQDVKSLLKGWVDD